MKMICLLTGIAWIGFFNNNPCDGTVSTDLIVGKWCSVSTSDFSGLTFSDNGSLVIDARADTLYRLKYSRMSNGYMLFKGMDSKTYLSKIEMLCKDSLVLQGLLDSKGRQAFYKCDKIK